MKPVLIILFILSLNHSFSQKDKGKILAHFDYVEYYPDSTIRAAHQYTATSLEQFAVEFNALGKPVAMGNYKKGKRTGKWIYADGSSDFFNEKLNRSQFSYSLAEKVDWAGNRTGSVHPGCGTGTYLAAVEFQKVYENLLNPEKKNEK